MLLVFASSKGGVGKSTACAAIGAALAIGGDRVLIIDLDPNRTLERWSSKVSLKNLDIKAVSTADFTGVINREREAGRYNHILVDLMGSREATRR